MRFDQSAIREIIARIDIGTYIGQYVQLQKRGRDLVGLCPFHGERSASFHVHPAEGYFKCFGCGVGGDVIAFVQKHENVPFQDAVRMLAKTAGVELEPENPQAARRRSERETIHEINRIATAYFARMLASKEGTAARAYCEKRGFPQATIEQFQLGFAPDRWEGLRDELQRNDVDLALAAKASLLKPGQRGFYDFFRNRLMVPTFSTTGEIIAFGGRALGDEEPKYLNTGSTPVYTKGEHLFALNVARKAANDDRMLVVVEGYLDCIALHQAGFPNAVAALGTAFTEKQAAELRKYADNIYLCFDADAAGEQATFKALEVATNVIEHVGMHVRVVTLPKGEDPDSFVRAYGRDKFAELLRTASPAIEFRLEREARRITKTFASPGKIAQEAEAVVRRMVPMVDWDRWRLFIANRLQVDVNALRNSRFFTNEQNFAPRSGVAGARHAPAKAQPLSFEREVLAIVIEDPVLAREYGARIAPSRFRNPEYRTIYERILEQSNGLQTTADVVALFAQDQASLRAVTALGRPDRSGTARYADEAERRGHLDRIVERLQLDDEKARYQELSHHIDDLLTAGEPVSSALRSEFDALVVKLKK